MINISRSAESAHVGPGQGRSSFVQNLVTAFPMSGIQPLPVEDATIATVLLVMVPPLASRQETAGPLPALPAYVAALQQQVGAAVLVLKVDEASYPAVVRSFAPLHLPALVLVQQGAELWRQEGLLAAEEVGPLIRAKIQEVVC